MIRHKATLLSTLFLAASTSLLPAKEKAWFVDTTLIYEQGSRLSTAYLQNNAPGFPKKLEGILPWVVRIEVQHGISKDGYTSNHGTGVILKDGKVITARHVLTKNVKDLKAKTKILLTTVNGRVFEANVIKKGEKDWMMLKIKITDDQKAMLQSPIRTALPQKNETAVFLGYPARLGLNEFGKVQSFHKGNKKKNIPLSQLLPMTVVGSVADTQTMTLKPLAGFPPVGGMSGGPVFNLKGEVIGAQHSVTTTREDATGKVLRYTIDTVPMSEITPLTGSLPSTFRPQNLKRRVVRDPTAQ